MYQKGEGSEMFSGIRLVVDTRSIQMTQLSFNQIEFTAGR